MTQYTAKEELKIGITDSAAIERIYCIIMVNIIAPLTEDAVLMCVQHVRRSHLVASRSQDSCWTLHSSTKLRQCYKHLHSSLSCAWQPCFKADRAHQLGSALHRK